MFSADKNAAFLNQFEEKSGISNAFSSLPVNAAKKRNGIIERLAKLSRAQPNNRLGRVRCSISDDIARIFLLKNSRSLPIICG